MPKIYRASVFALLCSATFLQTPSLHAQDHPAAPAATPAITPLPLDAVLVLTPEFCATKFSQGSIWTTGKEKFQVGKEACADLESALKPAFASLTVAAAVPTAGKFQIVLEPRFVDSHATTTTLAFSNREMDVFLEWTVKDPAGKTLWLQTVQGTAKHHSGNVFTHGHDLKLITQSSIKDVADQSVAKMTGAPELRKLNASN